MEDKPKHILFISFFYPPFNSTASQRTKKIVSGLRDLGFNVTVITARRGYKNELKFNPLDTFFIKILSVDYLLDSSTIRKSKFLYYFARLINRGLFYSTSKLPEISLAIWRNMAFKKALKIHEINPIDLIYTSSGPIASSIVGNKFKLRTNVPWIAEFRDLWTKNHYVNFSKISLWYNTKEEKKTLKSADALITVTKLLKSQLANFHGKQTYVIYNFFDKLLEDLNPLNSNLLVVTYAGQIIQDKRDPTPLFEAINTIKEKDPELFLKLKVNFYTNRKDIIKNLIDKYNVNEIVFNSGYIPYNEIQKVLAESHILLLLSYNHFIDRGNLTGKLFEYLSHQKPILSISYPGEIKEVLELTGSGLVINEPNVMENFLKNAIAIYKSDPKLGFSLKKNEILQFRSDYQLRKLSNIINKYIDITHSSIGT